MLYDEKETRFERTCRSLSETSFYYRFAELRACCGYIRR